MEQDGAGEEESEEGIWSVVSLVLFDNYSFEVQCMEVYLSVAPWWH